MTVSPELTVERLLDALAFELSRSPLTIRVQGLTAEEIVRKARERIMTMTSEVRREERIAWDAFVSANMHSLEPEKAAADADRALELRRERFPLGRDRT